MAGSISILVCCALFLQRSSCQHEQQEQRVVFRPELEGGQCQTQGSPPRAGVCRPLVQCITVFTELAELRRQPCPLRNGQLGVCCPHKGHTIPPPVTPAKPNTGVLSPPPPPFVIVPPIKREEIQLAITIGFDKINDRKNLETILVTNQIIVEPGTPAFHHQEFFQTTQETLGKGEEAQKNLEASVQLVNDFQLTPDQGTFALPAFSILDTVIGETCPKFPQCSQDRYRTIDGSCNNLENWNWGRANTAFQRILPPKYSDGVNSPREGANGRPLPSARLVSSTVTGGRGESYENYTLMVMQWGQFLDHDLTHTPIVKGPNQVGITCCRRGQVIADEFRHPDCFPIEIPPNDSFYNRFRQQCMEFVRSLPAPRPACNFGPREQMNQITGFLDASNVYGSHVQMSFRLREGRGGLLKTQQHGNSQLLPAKPEECSDRTGRHSCFQAGDARANEQVELAVLHTVWVREHNRIANELARINPHWDDETLYQEARRIVIAEMQHITYNEYLPLILGSAYMNKFELAPKEQGHTNLYDPTLNPSITNVFATAAYRYGHTLIPDAFEAYSQFGSLVKDLPLHEQQFRPFELYETDGLDNFVRGLTTQPPQRFDHIFTEELTNRLFQSPGVPFGLDLIALNLQRGRDHGLPSYNDWRQVCGLPRANNWQDLAQFMDPKVSSQLRELYGSVEEIDLFIGSVAENPLQGALLGPTFVCLVGDQFARLKRGDRFYYEERAANPFDTEQLQQLRKSSLSRVLCDNADGITHMQPLAFLQSSFLNKRVPCLSDAIPHVDLSLWSERGRQ